MKINMETPSQRKTPHRRFSPKSIASLMMLSLVLVLASVSSGWSQGSVVFENFVTFQTPDPTGGFRLVYAVGSPVDLATGVGLVGSQWVVM